MNDQSVAGHTLTQASAPYGDLRLADDLTLPLAAVTETFAILGRRGSGKTHTAAVLAEEMLKAGAHVVVIDPLDAWWGLRAHADGEAEGLPVVVFGGRHGDLPLDAESGAAIADFVLEEGLSVVLSLRHLRGRVTQPNGSELTAQQHVVLSFCERLYSRKAEAAYRDIPLHVMVDEARTFVPQRLQKGQERLVDAVGAIVRNGRIDGFGMTLIDQRPASVNNDVLSQTEVFVLGQLTLPADQKAVLVAVENRATPAQRDAFIRDLPSLRVGEMYVYSPGWLDLLVKVRIRPRETFDSSATPQFGVVRREPRRLADVDLSAIQGRLTALVARAESDDPAVLRRRIAVLENQGRAGPVSPRVERIEIPVFASDSQEHLGNLVDRFTHLVREVEALTHEFHDALARAERLATVAQACQTVVPSEVSRKTEAEFSREAEKHPPAGQGKTPRGRGSMPTHGLSAPQRRILDTLATFASLGLHDVARSNVAVVSQQSPASSGFSNNLSALRSLGYVDYPQGGRVALSETGRALATPTGTFRSRADLHDAWYARLSRPRAALLAALIALYPASIEREDLAHTVGQSSTSSGYSNNLSALRTMGLIDYPRSGCVAATSLLFPADLV